MCGPEAERLFCGEITDGSDIRMAREYLARRYEPALIVVEFNRHKDAPMLWRIERIAAAGTLSGEALGVLG